MNKLRLLSILPIFIAGLLLALLFDVLHAADSFQDPYVDNGSELSAIPSKISYQGVYSQDDVNVSGNRDMVFQLFANESCSGSALQSITKNDVSLHNGLFNVVLEVNMAHFNGQELWLQVQIDGNNFGCEQILPSPYALYSTSTDFHNLLGTTLTGLNSPVVITGTYSALPLSPGAAVGAPLVVSNVLTTGMGVRVLNATYGLYVDQAQWYGLWISQAGLYGIVSHGNDIGVMGQANSTGANFGLYGNTLSPSGTGVYGTATATSGTTYGVQGVASSTSGYGVYGTNTGVGVYGQSTGTSGYGGRFESNQYRGMYAKGGFNWYDAYIDGHNDAFGLYVQDGITTPGNISKGGGSFKIDHPLDPENRYLYHSFVESPDMMNIYNGNVVLDENGEAWVQLAEWFEALNIDYRYQLTPIGGPGPNLYIAQKIENNRFKIAGGTAGLEVSWQVTGIRNDPYAQAYRIPIEEDKPQHERGTYLHPDAYGVPHELGVHHLLREAEDMDE
jgi:hypothetical protein